MSNLSDEIARRRTFAIISHPDAGKTTLTEKLLLFGGAIQLAGEVKARGERRRVRSDWMAVERERGISVSSAVLSFEHQGLAFDLLGTDDLFADALLLFERGVHDRVTEPVRCSGLDDPKLPRLLPKAALAKLREEVEMAKGLCPPFDAQAYREGHLTPVYFGSALNNFGVRGLVQGVAELAPAPRPQPADPRPISPDEPEVAGFVFKVQANIDPQHRDRIAFVRLASGCFQRGMKLKN